MKIKFSAKAMELFEKLLELVIILFAKSGKVDLLSFKESAEYRYLKDLFENSFLSNQLFDSKIIS